MNIMSVGSVCSGIEAASVALGRLKLQFKWFSEILPFPSRVLNEHYPDVRNLGDMHNIPDLLGKSLIDAPDIICGGTPCQAFSLAGWKNGLKDERGNLTLKFVDIVESNDSQRVQNELKPTIVFWENVEGVLVDKTNPFGCFISSLAGLDDVMKMDKWPSAGILKGPKRNIAWRVLDAKFFGIPQQRRRLYLLAGGKDFHPEQVLFETMNKMPKDNKFPNSELSFTKDNSEFQIFREYTDCLYSAYGTKWNGNAAAYNGSLFIVQDGRLRRLSPLECERLMGFPDNYTLLDGAKKTNRYQAIGNSWAIPVIEWIGERLIKYLDCKPSTILPMWENVKIFENSEKYEFINLGKEYKLLTDGLYLNCTSAPNEPVYSSLKDIVSINAPEDIYISPVGCYGIFRRKTERGIKINARLEQVLLNTSSKMDISQIEEKSRTQKRGAFSSSHNMVYNCFNF